MEEKLTAVLAGMRASVVEYCAHDARESRACGEILGYWLHKLLDATQIQLPPIKRNKAAKERERAARAL